MEFLVNDKGTLIKIDGANESKVVLPSNALRIGKGLFANKNEIEEVILPESLKVIGEQSFLSCSNLKKVNFSNTEQILKNAFKNCRNLKNVNLSSNLKVIGEDAFVDCVSIESVNIPKDVKVLEKGCFFGCSSLLNIDFNPGLETICENVFNNCISLKDINLPLTLIEIGESAFSNCKNLENINFPPLLRTIGKRAFYNCTSLKNIELPRSLISIKEGAFERCFNLESVVLPRTLNEIGVGAFMACNNLNKIVINNYENISSGGLASLSGYTYYLDKETNQIIMSKDIILDDKRYRYLDYEYIYKNYGISSKYNSVIASILFTKEELETKEISSISYLVKNLVKEDINKDNYKEIANSLYNSKEFINLISHIEKELGIKNNNYDSNEQLLKMSFDNKAYDIFKLAYSLGAFNENKAERQKACEFIKNLYDKNILTGENMRPILLGFKFKPYNKEFAEFIMNKDNFVSILNEQTNLFSKVSNNFEEIREFGRSNKGKQDYRKVTVEMCIKYCKRIEFDGVNLNNSDIAKIVGKYTRNQDTFNAAREIRDEYLRLKKEGKIQEHLLGVEYKDNDVFALIEEERKNILNGTKEVLQDLNAISNNRFTFEFLSKYDPDNFVLGKYCSCCAHLEGTGYSVMKASMLHPDCQNLVIRDNNGRIVAKSTLYINRNQGYGLFNNIEINSTIKKEDKIKIYQKYIQAVRSFANEYNKKNPNNPLTQINVGMDNNKLSDILMENNEIAEVLLEGINFTSYGKVNQLHSGDWQKEQRVLWQSDVTKKKGGK